MNKIKKVLNQSLVHCYSLLILVPLNSALAMPEHRHTLPPPTLYNETRSVFPPTAPTPLRKTESQSVAKLQTTINYYSSFWVIDLKNR